MLKAFLVYLEATNLTLSRSCKLYISKQFFVSTQNQYYFIRKLMCVIWRQFEISDVSIQNRLLTILCNELWNNFINIKNKLCGWVLIICNFKQIIIFQAVVYIDYKNSMNEKNFWLCHHVLLFSVLIFLVINF